ncbi:MAG: hypothetical protein Kow0075_12540 [Salibacteraceae bacterium]
MCAPDTVKFTFEKSTSIQRSSFYPLNTNAAYQYFEAPQEIQVSGVRFYGYKDDTVGGNSMTVTVEMRRATSDTVPGNTLLASATITLTVPDSTNGPLSAYRHQVTWAPVTTAHPYCIVVRTESNQPNFTLFHNKVTGTNPDGKQEWLSGVRQGLSWIRGYAYLPTGSYPFDADFYFMPFVQYSINASFINDPKCLFNELGESVTFYNDGAPIVDSRMYNRFAFYNLPDRQKWVFGDGTPPTYVPNPIHFYPSNGPFAATMTVRLLSWTQNLCTSTVTQVIEEKPDQDFSYTTNNLEVQFKNETFGLFSNIRYDFGDKNYSLSENPKHKFAKPGTYWVCQTMTTSCGEITKCKNVAVATNTALNCGKDSVRYTSARATKVRTIQLKNYNPGRLYGVGQIFDAPQSLIVHGFTFYANHDGLYRDSYPVTCRIYKKGSAQVPEGEPLAESTVYINKVDADTNYGPETRYTAIFNRPVGVTFDYVLTIEYDSILPVKIGTSDWEAQDGQQDLLAVGKINDSTWVRSTSVAVFNVNGMPFDADVIIEPLVEYNIDANFKWDWECMELDGNQWCFEDVSSPIIRSPIYNTTSFYTTSLYSYEWNFDDGTGISNQLDACHKFEGVGPFDVSLTIILDGWTTNCVDVQTKNVPVPPTGGFSFEKVTSTVQFYDSSANAEEFLWTFSDNTISTLRNPIHYFTDTGKFEVCQYVSNECGSDTNCVIIEINTLDIEEILDKHLKVFPNPASDMLYVNTGKPWSDEVEVLLRDVSGRIIKTTKIGPNQSTTSMYVGDVANGPYMLNFKSDGFDYTRMIVIGD